MDSGSILYQMIHVCDDAISFSDEKEIKTLRVDERASVESS